jgi:DNA-binding HxlR family transcriptional regulator
MAADNGAEIPTGCPIDRMLRLLWREWTTHIVWVLGGSGPTSFGDLRRRLSGVSPKVLTERLRRMESDGLVYRQQEPSGLRRVTYSLTGRGQEVHSALRAFDDIANGWA